MTKQLLTIIFIFPILCYSQNNLIPNSSFEISEIIGFPTGISQLELLNDWENFNSSDWISESELDSHYHEDFFHGEFGDPFILGETMQAHKGNFFIGFGPCEGAQVKLNKSIKASEVVKISFWWSSRFNEDTEINVYLLEEMSNGINNCLMPNITFQLNEKAKVNSGGADAEHKAGQWYYYESKAFNIEGDKDLEYNWFAIKGKNKDGTLTSREYVFIDDVKVTAEPLCDYKCPNKGQIEIYDNTESLNEINVDVVIGNTSPFKLKIYNATKIEFSIYAGPWGKQFEFATYDPNVLKTNDLDYFQLLWSGGRPNGNWLTTPHTYEYKIKATSCNSATKIIIGQITVISTEGPPIYFPKEVPKNQYIDDCCEESTVFNNIIFEDALFLTTDDYIFAGTGNQTLIPNYSLVEFVAENKIVLGPGFHAKGEFLAKISECDFQNKMKSTSQQQEDDNTEAEADGGRLALTEYINSDIVENKDNLDIINIYPNPNNGKFTIKINKNITEIVELEIMDLTSKSIFKNSEINNQFKIDLSNYHKGIYLLKIRIDQELHVRKIIYN